MTGLLRSEGILAQAGAGGVVAPTFANFQSVINDSDVLSTQTGDAESIVAGNLHIVIIAYRRSGSGGPTFTVTLGGAAVTVLDYTAPIQSDPGLWIGTITPAGSGTLSLSVGTVSAWSSMIAAIVQVNNFGSFGTVASANVATATSYSAAYNTTVNSALFLGAITVQNGTLSYTPNATVPTVELLDLSSGASTTADQVLFVGTFAAPTAGSYTWGASWVSSVKFARFAVEIKPA